MKCWCGQAAELVLLGYKTGSGGCRFCPQLSRVADRLQEVKSTRDSAAQTASKQRNTTSAARILSAKRDINCHYRIITVISEKTQNTHPSNNSCIDVTFI